MVRATQELRAASRGPLAKPVEQKAQRPSFQQLYENLHKNEVGAVTWPRRTLTGKREVLALLLPSVGSDEEMGGDPPVFVAGQVLVRTVLRLEPLFGDVLPRWYVPDEHVEDSKVLLRALRMQAIDSALAVLRALCHCGAEAVLAVGEGVLPLLVVLHRSLRFQAYIARSRAGSVGRCSSQGAVCFTASALYAPSLRGLTGSG